MSIMLIIPQTGARGNLQTMVTQLVLRRRLGTSVSTSGYTSLDQGHLSWDH